MPDPGYLVGVVAIAAALTVALRAVPFAVLARLRESSVLDDLSRRLPAGIMVILVVYLLRDLSPGRPVGAVATLAAVALTVAVHLWRRHALLSIATGTAAHVLMISLIPVR